KKRTVHLRQKNRTFLHESTKTFGFFLTTFLTNPYYENVQNGCDQVATVRLGQSGYQILSGGQARQMERFFKLNEHGTNVRTEIMAGLVTFMTMAYILAVNPTILQATGLSWESIFLATAIAAGVITIAMGLFVNFPVALAPGMGLNAYFATVVLSSQGQFTASMALTAVFISGIIFIILTVTQVRQLLIDAVPDNLNYAITVGIGLFITIIGMKNSGVMTINV